MLKKCNTKNLEHHFNLCYIDTAVWRWLNLWVTCFMYLFEICQSFVTVKMYVIIQKKYVCTMFFSSSLDIYFFYEIILQTYTHSLTHMYLDIWDSGKKIAPYMVLIFNLLNYFLKIFQTLFCTHFLFTSLLTFIK